MLRPALCGKEEEAGETLCVEGNWNAAGDARLMSTPAPAPCVAEGGPPLRAEAIRMSPLLCDRLRDGRRSAGTTVAVDEDDACADGESNAALLRSMTTASAGGISMLGGPRVERISRYAGFSRVGPGFSVTSLELPSSVVSGLFGLGGLLDEVRGSPPFGEGARSSSDVCRLDVASFDFDRFGCRNGADLASRGVDGMFREVDDAFFTSISVRMGDGAAEEDEEEWPGRANAMGGLGVLR